MDSIIKQILQKLNLPQKQTNSGCCCWSLRSANIHSLVCVLWLFCFRTLDASIFLILQVSVWVWWLGLLQALALRLSRSMKELKRLSSQPWLAMHCCTTSSWPGSSAACSILSVWSGNDKSLINSAIHYHASLSSQQWDVFLMLM